MGKPLCFSLRDADLRDTDLQWASRVGAYLRGAKLEGCSLWHTIYDNATHWLEGLSPPSEASAAWEPPLLAILDLLRIMKKR